MTTEYCVAFIDVLGYSSAVDDCIEGAVGLLSDYSDILATRIVDNASHPLPEYNDQLRPVAERSYVTSFDYFLPMSDSVFVFSRDASLFVKQLSNFLFESFLVGSSPFEHRNDDERDIRNVDIRVISKEGAHDGVRRQNPLLFRGGIDFGEAGTIKMPAITSSQLGQIYNVIGKAVVGSVHLEPKKRGPRIICSARFVDQIADPGPWIGRAFDGTGEYELYWPVAAIGRHNSAEVASMNHLRGLFTSTINLWWAFRLQGRQTHSEKL